MNDNLVTTGGIREGDCHERVEKFLQENNFAKVEKFIFSGFIKKTIKNCTNILIDIEQSELVISNTLVFVG